MREIKLNEKKEIVIDENRIKQLLQEEYKRKEELQFLNDQLLK